MRRAGTKPESAIGHLRLLILDRMEGPKNYHHD